MTNDKLTERIIGVCYEIHNELGPGFTERIYHNALKMSLEQHFLKYVSEKSFPVKFQDNLVGNFRVDLIVEDRVVIEIKALTGIIPKVFEAQLLSYLKAANLKVGLLVNFSNRKCQIRRLVNE